MDQPADTQVLTGEIVEGGIECPLFQASDGHLFALEGLTHAAAPVGTRLKAEMEPLFVSICQQGDAMRVVKVLEQGAP
ncbi:hypothetical protein [Mongoliimonas terrestris]|uniref:hypothetical protein n=1 Tax=Mongoliimonas terrestris TaxID=1709001 RepID=UPI0009498151|nr:hypothetical protein [Mongoliimonas terrestris]